MLPRRTALALCLACLAAPLAAQSDKEADCGYQADVAAAVQQARLEGVREARVAETIAASNPTWPARYNNAIPLLTAQFYQLKKRDLRDVDMRMVYFDACMAQ
jgi:hypothetical protein